MATWTTVPGNARSMQSAQAANETDAPIGDEGVSLVNVAGFTIFVSADEGETLTGSGDLVAYLKSHILDRWARADDQLDLTIPGEAAGNRTFCFTGFSVPSPRGRLAHLCSNVGVSAGGVTLTYEATSQQYGTV